LISSDIRSLASANNESEYRGAFSSLPNSPLSPAQFAVVAVTGRAHPVSDGSLRVVEGATPNVMARFRFLSNTAVEGGCFIAIIGAVGNPNPLVIIVVPAAAAVVLGMSGSKKLSFDIFVQR
jgi:hypothetical protein